MRIQHSLSMFILTASLGLFGSDAATAADSGAGNRAPGTVQLAYGYGYGDRDDDRRDWRDHDDDRRGWHDHHRYDEVVREHVKRGLWRTLGERARFIDVGVRGGYVVLTGQVDYRRDRDYAYNVAFNTRGVRAVDNRIYVRRTYR